jgi:hypothetical protein
MEYYKEDSELKLKIDPGICPEILLKLKSLQERAWVYDHPTLWYNTNITLDDCFHFCKQKTNDKYRHDSKLKRNIYILQVYNKRKIVILEKISGCKKWSLWQTSNEHVKLGSEII